MPIILVYRVALFRSASNLLYKSYTWCLVFDKVAFKLLLSIIEGYLCRQLNPLLL